MAIPIIVLLLFIAYMMERKDNRDIDKEIDRELEEEELNNPHF